MQQLPEQATRSFQALARIDLLFFTRWMFLQRRGYKWLMSPHHRIICDALTRVYNGECKRLIINIPPRYSKTEIAVINFMAWALGQCPDAEFIHTSYSGRLAANNAWQARELVQSEQYRHIFPETNLRTDSSARDEWRTTAGGCVYAVGAGGTITGYGAGKHRPGFGGCILIDDPHKADEARSDVMRKNVLEWFQNTLESRKNSPDTPIILIMQRLHEEDLAGWLLAGGNGEEWEHICLPALQEDGSALWPAKHSAEELQRMQKSAPYTFSGQYQQRPSPLGGGILKGEWFKRYTVAPRFRYRKIFADTAQKTKEANDFSVFQCWGASDDGCAYLLDQIRGKWEAPELKRRAVDFWLKHQDADPVLHGGLRTMAIEDKSSGTGLIQSLSKESSIPVMPIERVKDKLTRVMDVADYVASGRVFIPEQSPFVADFVAECEAFTPDDSHAHDDQIDPMCDAINDMVAAGNNLLTWARLAD